MTATAQPPRMRHRHLAAYFDRKRAAEAWRRDHLDDPLRDQAWRAFCNGVLWGARQADARQRQALQEALTAAQIAVPFPPAPLTSSTAP
jgi:hypothetical protein